MTTGEHDIESIIRKKVPGSTIYVFLGLLGFVGILLCPLAFFRCSQALRMIDKHGVGESYRKLANQVRVGAAVLFFIWAGVAAFFIWAGIAGLQ